MDASPQIFILARHPLQPAAPRNPRPQGWSEPPGGAGTGGGGAAWLCPGAVGRGVLREGVLLWGRPGSRSGKRHNGRKPHFRFPMEKTLQNPWGEQPDIINVKISWEDKQWPEAAPSQEQVLLAWRSLALGALVAQATTYQDSHAQRTEAIPTMPQHKAQCRLLPARSPALLQAGDTPHFHLTGWDGPCWAGASVG